MSKLTGILEDRPPLKDTSKKFINTNTTPKTTCSNTRSENSHALTSFKKPSIDPHQNETASDRRLQFKGHVQNLTSGDNHPHLMDTSTPKKDGHIPYLTNPNSLTQKNNTNITNNTGTNIHALSGPAVTTTTSNNTNNANNNSTAIVKSANRTVTKKMTGNELSKWQQTWKHILPRSYIYFEQDDTNDREKRKAMLALKKMGATIEPFFCENVTIIISRRVFDKNEQYPKGDIFKYAIKKQLKVWTIEKVFRFLNHLGEPILDTDDYEDDGIKIPSIIFNNNSNNNNIININNINNNNDNDNDNNANNNINNNSNLSNLLMNERLFGPSDCDPSVRRNDFKYFTGLYLYIWDITHKTRPIAIREWKDKYSYPKIHHTTNGKSLFILESKSQSPLNILKRHQRRLTCLNETFDFRQKIIESSYDESNLKLIRHPNYRERVEFKRLWEDNYYKLNLEELPSRKFRAIYDSLNEVEKQPFKDLFLNNSKITELDNQNDYNHHCNSDDHNDNCYARDDDKDGDSDDRYNMSLLDKLVGKYPIQEIKRQKLNNKTVKKIEKIDNEIDEENLENLISDKSDLIDKISNPLIPDTREICNDVEEHNEGEGEGEEEDLYEDGEDEEEDGLIINKIDLVGKKPHKVNDIGDNNEIDSNVNLNQLKNMPKLMRQDSIICGSNSQAGNVDGKMHEYGEITASGIQASGVNPAGTCSQGHMFNFGNGLAPSKSQVINKTLANESKRIVVLTPSIKNKHKYEINLEKEKQLDSHVLIRQQKENTKRNGIFSWEINHKHGDQVGQDKSTSNNLANEDDLAALRSVEAAITNPFISDGYLKNTNKNTIPETKKNGNPIQKANQKLIPSKQKPSVNNETKNTKSNQETVALGIFKEEKPEKGKHEIKPGYCENCRVKYSDFSSHVQTDKHRSFAEDDSNFRQIDDLIKSLKTNV